MRHTIIEQRCISLTGCETTPVSVLKKGEMLYVQHVLRLEGLAAKQQAGDSFLILEEPDKRM